ncbi:MAG TPA: cbb3-type cytochrome oxidase assembly protein CcoS [Thermodesulfovibrionales bacterium]|jgi:cbb3-type cytochrome oxidase maturation protein|nr:cbb3-type cytochrome oxidase assembly protein CcoS [Thermodesulfovibrionales bacterium]
MWAITFMIFLSLVLGIGAWLFFIWSVKSGQYDDVEGPKYRMLEDEEKKSGDRTEQNDK